MPNDSAHAATQLGGVVLAGAGLLWLGAVPQPLQATSILALTWERLELALQPADLMSAS